MQFFRFLVMTIFVSVMWILVGYNWGKREGIAEGRNTAMKEALRTNPPSEELEMTCLGLWLGEQNKKHYEKENRRAR